MTLFSSRSTGFAQGVEAAVRVAGLALVFFIGFTAGWGESVGFAASPCTIVIDPGHGGDDVGCIGGDGLQEKETVLRMAEQVAAGLGNRFRVVLTRTGDYRVDLAGRTGSANRLGADLLVSLHVTPSSAGRGLRAAVYHYDRRHQVRSRSHTYRSGGEDHIRFEPWEDVQVKHMNTSRQMAELMAGALQEGKGNGNGQVLVEGAPLVVLEGAGMPALLIEVSFGTKEMSAEQALTAEVLVRGIERCMEQLPCSADDGE